MPIRVVMIKPGLDSHYRGALAVCRHLAEDGMEVIYAGHQNAPGAVAVIEQEDADVLGISSLSGNHLRTIPQILRSLREHSLGHVLVIVGGVIPEPDRALLYEAGVAEVFGSGTPLHHISDYINHALPARQSPDDPRRLL
ncbi:cobalamin-dependent protein [Streptomyces tsukubensis]|uniref:cobalamin-dependent protein n=1 Tax=Streptomyces tsukubensis TaxID=83656 RepID=UPI00344DF7CE